MLIAREGRFKARIIEQGVDETGPNKLVTFTARFRIEQEFRESEWFDISAENAEITGYFYLEKRDGSINMTAIEQLKDALDWDGRDPFWLQDMDLGDRLVQITVAMETYDGKTRPRVRWLSREDAEPTLGVSRASDATRRAIVNRLGPKLRANAGGAPRPAPPPSAPRPTPLRASIMTPTSRPGATPADAAWTAFIEAFPAEVSSTECERQWFKILGEMFPDRDLAQLTADEWKRVAEEAPRQIVPF